MPATYDPATDTGRVRLLAADTDLDQPLLSDADIAAFLDLEDGNVKRAAAQALDTIASSEALVSKKIRTQDLQTDGPAVAAELRARAASLREQADQDDEHTGGGLDIVDFDPWAGYGPDAELAEPGWG